MIDLVRILVGPIAGLLDKIIPDKDAREKMAHEIATLAENHAQEQLLAQLEINKQEAAHKSLFVAGWRPFTGWGCGLALVFTYLVAPILNWATALYGVTDPNGLPVVLPTLDLGVMLPVLMGMLGLSWNRTQEKKAGVARER